MASINSHNIPSQLGNTLRTYAQTKSEEPEKQDRRGLSSAPKTRTNTPADQTSLTISNVRKEPTDTYTHLKESLTAEQLSLDDIRGSLSQLRNLSGFTSSYEGTQRTVHAPGTRQADSKNGDLFTINVTTKDGDTVELTINRSSGTENGRDGEYQFTDTTLSFVVNGELDEGERDAVAQLALKLGSLGDEYRSEDWAKLGELKAFNEEELSGFSLKVAGNEGNSFKVDYAIDELADQRTLSTNLNDYTYDLQVDIHGLYLDSDLSNNEQYQQHRDLIRSTVMDYEGSEDAGGKSEQVTATFFLEGMDALFGAKAPAATDEDDEPANIDDDINRTLDRNLGKKDGLLEAFSTGLADFSAEFKTPLLRPNEEVQSEVSTLELHISQDSSVTTKKSQDHSLTNISQQTEYSSKISQHLDYVPLEDGGVGDSYLYRTDIKSGSLTRTLGILDDKTPLYIDENRTQEHRQIDKLVVDGFIEKKTDTDLSKPEENTQERKILASLPRDKNMTQKQLQDYLLIEPKSTYSTQA